MARKALGRDEKVLAVVRPALRTLLELGVKYRLHKHIIDEKQRDWRELEAELSYTALHKIRGFGITATRENIEIQDSEEMGSDRYRSTRPWHRIRLRFWKHLATRSFP